MSNKKRIDELTKNIEDIEDLVSDLLRDIKELKQLRANLESHA